MTRLQIYVPRELKAVLDQVKLPISEICQEAIMDELQKMANVNSPEIDTREFELAIGASNQATAIDSFDKQLLRLECLKIAAAQNNSQQAATNTVQAAQNYFDFVLGH